jgi:hypothetical protein
MPKAAPEKASDKPAERTPKLHQATADRVEAIAQTMRDGTFRHGVTLPAFRAKWGLCQQRVGELSTLAAKKVRAEHDPDIVAAKGFSALERIADNAMADDDIESRKLALKAYDTWLVRSGAAAPTKATVAVTGDLSQLTDEQLEARKSEVLARLAVAAASAAKGDDE